MQEKVGYFCKTAPYLVVVSYLNRLCPVEITEPLASGVGHARTCAPQSLAIAEVIL